MKKLERVSELEWRGGGETRTKIKRKSTEISRRDEMLRTVRAREHALATREECTPSVPFPGLIRSSRKNIRRRRWRRRTEICIFDGLSWCRSPFEKTVSHLFKLSFSSGQVTLQNLKMGRPRPLFCLFSSFSTMITTESLQAKRDSNLDRRHRRQAHYPLDHQHGPTTFQCSFDSISLTV